jgi:transposase InsO family protein
MDFITGLPSVILRNGNEVDSILVIVDRYTKMSTFIAVSCHISSQDLAQIYHEEIECRRGAGSVAGIVSDRGAVFTSQFWSDLCYLSQIKRRVSTAYHPQTDGQTERMNQTLEHYLRVFSTEDQTNWPYLLAEAEYACNNARNETIGMSPFQALMGFSPEFHERVEGDSAQKKVPLATERLQKLREVRTRLTNHWTDAAANQKRYYDKKHQKREFRKGELVALSAKNLKLHVPCRKLAPRFVGPFRIVDKVGTLAYRLALPEKYARIHNVFPISLLEPWHVRPGQNPLPMPDLEEDEEWEVEEVRDCQRVQDETFYLVKWTG